MADKPFKPMLAQKVDFALLQFPVFGSAKLDGVRALAMGGKAMSRSMKALPNRAVQAWFARHGKFLQGMDGELIVGSPTDPNVYSNTTSGVMSEHGVPDFTYFVFDRHDLPTAGYRERAATLFQPPSPRLRYLESELLTNMADLEAFEQKMLDIGYEGVMLRSLDGLYKQGRATAREGNLLKVKRYEDAEARIIGFEEEMFNGNEAMINELGHTKRSSHQGNKTGKGTLGAFIVEGINGQFAGVPFNIGTGFSAAQRALFWQQRDRLLGQLVTYKYFAVGVVDKPRHPVFKGFRDPIDM